MRKAIHRRIIALRNTVWYRHRVAARLAVVAVAVLVVYVAAFRGSPEPSRRTRAQIVDRVQRLSRLNKAARKLTDSLRKSLAHANARLASPPSPSPPDDVISQPLSQQENFRQGVLPVPPLPLGGDRWDGRVNKVGGRDPEKLEAIRGAFRLAWGGYSKYCYGEDELRPLSRTCSNWVHMGLTLIDSLDTLWIMGLKDEFHKAKRWVANELPVAPNEKVSFFESTIRVTGGLLSAYELSGDPVFLEKATQIQANLDQAFQDTEIGMPVSEINLKTGEGSLPGWTGKSLILSEIGTNAVEMLKLSQHTKKMEFANYAERVIDFLDQLETPVKGLYPSLISPKNGRPTSRRVSFGGMGDSWYEYLLKSWLLSSRQVDKYKRMYVETLQAIKTNMIKKSNGRIYLPTMEGTFTTRLMEHLVCFMPGLIALGSAEGVNQGRSAEDLRLAEELMDTCVEMYDMSESKLAPDSVRFSNQGMVIDKREFRLRPETVESLFYLWRITHKQKYRDAAWMIFQAMDRNCRVAGVGHANVKDVNDPSQKEDRMESFWLAETLKYLFLTFEDDSVIPLNKYVFNTEAHPLEKIPEQEMQVILSSLHGA
ncbi:hypothetical protein AAMO2058_000249600 [Amorphochlora amoebiformis]